jgi:hypothetical protein
MTGLLAGQSGGLPPEWEVSKSLEDLVTQVKRLEPVLSKVTPEEWVGKGAPDAYIKQWKDSQNELTYLVGSAQKMAKRPDKLPLALETFFRMEAMHAMLGSLTEGVRRYQNPALADLLQSLVNEDAAHREKLRQYIMDLADSREKEFQIVDSEAQRCRGTLSRQPAAAPRTKAVQK